MIEKILRFLGFEKVMGAMTTRWKLKRKIPVPSAPEPATPPPQTTIEYTINDPTTPDLVKSVLPPVPPVKPLFVVKDYRGGGFGHQSAEYQSANCFVTIANTLSHFTEMNGSTIPNWPGTAVLPVIPRAGSDLNAFYNRKSLQFFYARDPRIGTIFTADSSDIVAHELGHAILDTFRPDFWSAMSLEVASFHESFADFVAMMHIMLYDEALTHAINETGGDMRKSNVISRLSEQFGVAIYKLTNGEAGRSSDCLRNAVNSFNYVNPGSLPEDAPNDQLAAECHSFGRIFLGAFYDILVMIYEDVRATGADQIVALKQARDILSRYTIKAIQNVPLNSNLMIGMAKTLLWADVTLNDRKYHDRMQAIFSSRNLVSAQLMMLSAPNCDNDEGIVKIQSQKTIKLGDVLLRAQSNNPLYDVEVQIPLDQAYLYDNNRNLYDMIRISEEDAISAAQDMISHLHATNAVSDSPTTPWEIKDGKLVRTYFA